MLRTIILIILIWLSSTSFTQEGRTEVIKLLDLKVQEILPWNWYTVKTDTSISAYFCRTAMNLDLSEKDPLFYAIEDLNPYGKEFEGEPKPDSVYTELYLPLPLKSKLKKQDGIVTNNILRIDIILAPKGSSEVNSKFYEYPILIKESMGNHDRVVYNETVTPKKAYYDKRLGRELIREFNSLYLSIAYLSGIDRIVESQD